MHKSTITNDCQIQLRFTSCDRLSPTVFNNRLSGRDQTWRIVFIDIILTLFNYTQRLL